MYFSSPKPFQSETSLLSGISLPLNTETVDNRSGVIIENTTSNPGIEHVHGAFRLLCYSSTIQVINFRALNLISNHGIGVRWIEISQGVREMAEYRNFKTPLLDRSLN